MYYLLLSRNIGYNKDIGNYRVVTEVIPEYIPELPDVPIEERYSKDFLSKCIMFDFKVPLGSGILVN